MRYHICSRDSYFRIGLEAILDKVPVSAISCGGKTAFIDLSHPAGMNGFNKKEICHLFFIGDNEAVFDSLKNIQFRCDTYFIARDTNIDKYQNRIESLVTSIMLRHCFWSGVRFPLPLRASAKELIFKENENLHRLTDYRSLIKVNNNTELQIKTTHIFKTSTRIRSRKFIQHNQERQAIFIEKFHTQLNDNQKLTYLSGIEACRQIGGSLQDSK